MVAETMTTRNKSFIKTIIFFSLIFFAFPLFSEEGKWVLGAEKFKYAKGQVENSVTSSTAEMLPSDILEKLNRALERNVMPDEKFERSSYKLREERHSLYLQLSAEYKKRDAIVLKNYSAGKMKSEIKAEEKKIAEIQKKIDDNLAQLKENQNEMELQLAEIEAGHVNPEEREKSEFELFGNLFKRIFVKDKSYINSEQIKFYKEDYTQLFKPSVKAEEAGHLSYDYSKEINSAGINALVTGKVSEYGEYLSVEAELFIYPGAKSAGTVMEVGSRQDMDLIVSGLSRQLLPLITNAMPVEISIEINPAETASKALIYVDDILQKTDSKEIILESGVHLVQFVCNGYKTAGTSYYFYGNNRYKIQVNFEELKTGYLQVGLRNSIIGDFYMNSEKALKVDDKKSQISINGNTILGEFIGENGETAFFYIPKKLTFNGNYVTVRPKPKDRMSYIDKRRKWMYGAYSLLIVSLIPTFYTYGNFQNQVTLYNNNLTEYYTASRWQDASNITRLISIGCGIFWGYELVRYMLAANTVLPQTARQGDPEQFLYYEPVEPPPIEPAEMEEKQNEAGSTENEKLQGDKK